MSLLLPKLAPSGIARLVLQSARLSCRPMSSDAGARVSFITPQKLQPIPPTLSRFLPKLQAFAPLSPFLRPAQTRSYALESGPSTPGQSRELRSNSLWDRVPKFPFGKESIPKIIPDPNVPKVTRKLTFAHLIDILRQRKDPELIYEAESHKLYFVMAYSLALMFVLYALTFGEWSMSTAWQIYQENEKNLPQKELILDFLGKVGLNLLILSVPLFIVYLGLKLPTLLVRRMTFLPGHGKAEMEHVQLTTHPLIPGKASPVITVPLSKLSRDKRTTIYTGKGFYGTYDKASFCFFLWEEGRRLPWIVDRSGFFWGDGRVFDVLFGKEDVSVAEKGMRYGQKIIEMNKIHEKSKAKLREELGPAWRLKILANSSKIKNITTNVAKELQAEAQGREEKEKVHIEAGKGQKEASRVR